MSRKFLRPLPALAALGFVAAAITIAAQTASAAEGTPKLVLEDTTYNAGEVPKGEVMIHDFKVKNEGDADLLILNVKPACGCTTPGYDKVIAPGSEGKITLKVDTARFKGPISKSAAVTTNDPAQPNVRLVMNGTVQTFIDVLPRDIVTFRQYRGEEKKQELTIRSNEEGDFEIKDVQVTGEHVEHELKPAGEGEDGYQLAVWIDDEAPIGNVNGQIKLLTNSAKEPEVNVTVRGNVLGQISVNPSTLYFRVDSAVSELEVVPKTLNLREQGELGAPVVTKLSQGERLEVLESADGWTKVKTAGDSEGWVYDKLVEPVSSGGAGSLQSKVLNVTHRQSGEFNITGTEVSGSKIDRDALKVETETVREGATYRVTVTYEGGLDKGNYTGKVILKTTDASEPAVEVPLYIVVT